jgi:2-oxoglutarate ferredoxin oxidoreductase subunit alpha
LHKDSFDHLKHRITPETIIIGDKSIINHDFVVDVQFNKIALECGNVIFSNTVAAGFICGLLQISFEECECFIKEHFSKKDEAIQNRNLEAMKKGLNTGKMISDITILIERSDPVKKQMILSGAESIALGAVAGGCNYVCGYPMSPSTSVLEKMASHSLKFDIIVEQVEDEVGVINMALGAWYAGARAMVTTSGGGFALMCEGISLCGMIESPLVVYLAQRPGPATGLPTRTEQGDLNLVLYAGHGDFPRIILAPGTPQEGYELTRKAFELSDKYQVPVFILTDQFFVDSKFTTPCFTVPEVAPANFIVITADNYNRFTFSPDGISPRGVPGNGTGLICADSDEHDESGHITENLDLRVRMVDKRISKSNAFRNDIHQPQLYGNKEYKTLVICWGSTGNTVVEAVLSLDIKDIAVIHFSWIFPLPENCVDYLRRATEIIVIENNASAQFAQLIQLETGFKINKKILKYNGLPFSVEEIAIKINKLL